MSPSEILAQAAADGVRLVRTSQGTLRALGGNAAVERWRTRVHEHRDALLDELMDREERAAIYEFDGKFSREEAERKAGL